MVVLIQFLMGKIIQKNKSIKWRKNGKSNKWISDKLNIPRETIWMWTKHIKLTKKQKKYLDDKRNKAHSKRLKVESLKISKECRIKRKKWQKDGWRMAKKHGNDFSFCCALYLGEGSKNRNVIQIVNYDKNMLKLFVQFLKKYFNVNSSDIIMQVTSYLDCGLSIKAIIKYWKKNLRIKNCIVYSSKIRKKDKNKKIRGYIKHPYGGCSLTICNTEKVQKLLGAIKYFTKNKTDKWVF